MAGGWREQVGRELLIPLVTDCRRYKSSWNEAALLAVLCYEQMFPKICLHDGCIDSEIFEKKDFYLKVLFFHNQSFFSFTLLNISICVLVFSCIRNSEMKKRKQFTICQVYRSKQHLGKPGTGYGCGFLLIHASNMISINFDLLDFRP